MASAIINKMSDRTGPKKFFHSLTLIHLFQHLERCVGFISSTVLRRCVYSYCEREK